jgi:hypothetical protein
MDLYNILNINKYASQNEIKQAYYKLAKIYHPDKNNTPDGHNKFIEINMAYEILYNNSTNKNYNNMDIDDKTNFNELLIKIRNIINNINSSNIFDIEKYFRKLCQSDIEYIKENFIYFIKNINIIELFELYYNGKLIKKNYLIYSDTESETNNEYYYVLPIYLQKNNKLDINIDILIDLNDILNNSIKKLKIKRMINNKNIISTFIYNLTHPYIVFYDKGDSDNINNGNLIIKLTLPNNIYWNNDILFIDYPMTLYELIYGININIDNLIIINKWIPYTDGFSIDVSKHINIIIKLYLNYEYNNTNYELLKNYFN